MTNDAIASDRLAPDRLHHKTQSADAELRAYLRSFLTPLLPIAAIGVALILVVFPGVQH